MTRKVGSLVVAAVSCALMACGSKATAPSSPQESATTTPAAKVLATVSITGALSAPGYPGIKSTQTLRLRAVDTDGAPLAGAKISVVGDTNGGWAYPAEVTTGTDGLAAFVWVPGSPGAGNLTATAVLSGVTKTVVVPTLSVNPPALPLSALNLYLDSQSASGYSIDLTPLTDPQGTYYAALVWKGGYAGLQRDGSLYHDQLQFSAWDETGGAARVITYGAGLSCVTFGGEGTGQACTVNYPWTINTTYRFEMDSVSVTGGRDVTLNVTNLTTQERRFIGTLFQPTVAPLTYVNTFVEQFHRVAPNCLEQPLRAYSFRRVLAKINGVWQALTSASVHKQEEPSSICSNVDAVTEANGVRVQIGQRTAADPKTPVILVVPQ